MLAITLNLNQDGFVTERMVRFSEEREKEG